MALTTAMELSSCQFLNDNSRIEQKEIFQRSTICRNSGRTVCNYAGGNGFVFYASVSCVFSLPMMTSLVGRGMLDGTKCVSVPALILLIQYSQCFCTFHDTVGR